MSRVAVFGLAFLARAAVCFAVPGDEIHILGRGDVNFDSTVSVSDVVYLNNWLYQGGPAPPCVNNADANGDGRVDNSDGVFLLNYLYNGGSAPPYPGPNNHSCLTNPNPSPNSCNAGC